MVASRSGATESVRGAAREPEVVHPRRVRFSAVGILVIVLLFFSIATLAPNFRLFLEQRQQIADVESAVAAQKNQVDSLSSERARWNDPAYVRAQARDRLYYVMPGEVSYLIVDDIQPGGQPSQPVSDTIQPTHVDWLHSLFGSLVLSGVTAKTPDELQAGTSGHAR